MLTSMAVSRFFRIGPILLATLLLAACSSGGGGGGGGGAAATLNTIAVTSTRVNLPKGMKEQLTAMGSFSDGTTSDITASVTWTSSDNLVATVDAAGLVTAVAPGAVTLTATDTTTNVTGTISLTITTAVVQSIVVAPANTNLAKGLTQAMTATGTFSDGTSADITNSVTWSSANTAVADFLGAAGVVTAKAVGGPVALTATDPGTNVSASTNLTVTSAVLQTIAVTPANLSLAKGINQQYTAMGNYSDGTSADLTASVVWSSLTPSTAAIDAAGFASTLAVGTTTIQAVFSGVTGSTVLTVTPAALVSIAVTPLNPSISKGLTQQMTAMGTYTDGTTVNITGSVTWSSSNTATATVVASGLATGAAVGSVTLTATDPVGGAISGSTSLTVTPAALVSIAVTPANPSVAAGLTQTFTATGTYTDNTQAVLTTGLTWSSNSTTVATVNASGVATGVTTGSAVITVADNATTISGSSTLTVTAAVLQSITVTPANPSIPNGMTTQFTATGNYSDGSQANLTATVAWAGTAGVATVNASGLATGVGVGVATVKATDGASGIVGSTNLTITAAILQSITVTPANPSIALGQTQTFTATGNYSDGSQAALTTGLTWTSSNTGVATVNNSGVASSVASGGPVTITVTDNATAISGTASLTVTPAVLLSIAVTPGATNLPMGLTQQMTAMGTYSDGTTVDMTNTVTWTTGAAGTVTVSALGVATPVAIGGPVTITATDGTSGNFGTASITVSAAVLTTITVNPTGPSIAKGQTQQFTATGSYSDGSSQDLTATVAWTTSNGAVASVSAAGLATGLAVGGPVTITATSAGISGTANLTVTAAVLNTITLTPANTTIAKGLTQAYTAMGNYSDGTSVNITNALTWTTSNGVVASVSAAGLATGLAVGGPVTITATDAVSGKTGTATLTVSAATLSTMTVTPANGAIPTGLTQQFTATGTYTDGSTANLTGSVTWSSSLVGVATIAAGGLATGVGGGTTVITAVSGAVSGTTNLTVAADTLLSIAVTPAASTLSRGTVQQMTATGTYQVSGAVNITSSVTWASSTSSVATVGASTGVVTVTGIAGATNITATKGAVVSPAATVTATAATVTSITVSPSTISLPAGLKQSFTATANMSDGTTKDLTTLATWTSSNTAVATVAAGGAGTAVATSGTPATMTATYTDPVNGAVKTGTAAFTVTPAILVSTAVTSLNTQLPAGVKEQYTATGTYSDATVYNITSSVTWASSNAAAATVSAAGLVTSVAAGSANITATLGGVVGTKALTVNAATLSTIAVTPVTTIWTTETQQMTAMGTYTNAQVVDISNVATWTSSLATTATVAAGGVATGKFPGTNNGATSTSTITATYQTKSGTAVLTVKSLVDEGTQAAPLALAKVAGTPLTYKGQAWGAGGNEASFYKITGLTVGTTYRVDMLNITTGSTFRLYDDPANVGNWTGATVSCQYDSTVATAQVVCFVTPVAAGGGAIGLRIRNNPTAAPGVVYTIYMP
ncbi:MAG: Ig-like domain-containing protein [Deltaproteobacteria bacterium]|nr:Ig-like domain-containing protein [Deltaproteobacteria bacterium]